MYLLRGHRLMEMEKTRRANATGDHFNWNNFHLTPTIPHAPISLYTPVTWVNLGNEEQFSSSVIIFFHLPPTNGYKQFFMHSIGMEVVEVLSCSHCVPYSTKAEMSEEQEMPGN